MDVKRLTNNKNAFTDMIRCIREISDHISKYGSSGISMNANVIKSLSDLKRNINDYFNKDYECLCITISDNADKEFFGMYIVRDINMYTLFVDDIRNIEEKDNKYYKIDLDSKLFTIGLAMAEIVSLILYDIYNIASYSASVDIISALDTILAGRNMGTSTHTLTRDPLDRLFKLCATEYLYRSRSIFASDENNIIRIPDFMRRTDYDQGMEETLMNGCETLFKVSNAAARVIPNPSIPLNWYISVAHNYSERTTYPMDVLNDYITTSGSNLLVQLAEIIARRFHESYTKTQKKIIGEASLFNGIRKSGLKSLENDVFEYEMRVKNVDDEDSAIFLMRQINSRMGIIGDYLDNENLPEMEYKRWRNLYDRYDKLRIKMTEKPIYSKKMYGLFVDYNALMQPGAENYMTMNTMY